MLHRGYNFFGKHVRFPSLLLHIVAGWNAVVLLFGWIPRLQAAGILEGNVVEF